MNLRAAVTWSRNVPLHLRNADEERAAYRVGVALIERMQQRGEPVYEAWITLRRTVRASAQRAVRGPRLTLTLDHRLLQHDDALLEALDVWSTKQDTAPLRSLLADISAEQPERLDTVRPISDPRLAVLLRKIARQMGVAELALTELRIIWSRAPSLPKPRARRIRLGSYLASERLIRLHPVLNEPDVPEIVREWVIHHELCHWLAPPRQVSSTRRAVHHSEFEALEDAFPGRAIAEQWIDEHLTTTYTRMMRRLALTR